MSMKELKELDAEAKALNEKRKALREEANANKAERIAARKTMTECRSRVDAAKKSLRDLTAKTYPTMKGDNLSSEVTDLAGEIETASAELVSALNDFAEAKAKTE